MSVELNPATQLGFPRPLTSLVKRSMLIHNPNSSPIAFKVKTTAPKQYCVRPNSGRVEAGETVEVQVLLQPLASEPPPHAKCKDKFLVQSAFIAPDEEMRTLGEMWAQTEKTNKSAIHEQKVKCAYLPADDGSMNHNGIPEEAEEGQTGEHSKMMEESQIYSAAQSSPVHRIMSGEKTSPPASAVPSASVDKTANPPMNEPPLPALSAAGPSPTNIALEQSVSTTAPESDKLKMDPREVDKLQARPAESVGPQVTGLRKRGGAVVSEVQAGAETAMEKTKQVVQGSTGVPIEVVAGLVVVVFVLTYLFF